MATTLTTATAVSEFDYRITNSDSTFPAPGTKANDYNYTFNPGGTSNAKVASKVFAKTYTLSGGATTNVDLSGSLTDPFGETVVFTKIKRIRVRHKDAGSASSVLVNGAASNSCTNLTATLKKGGWVDLVDPTAGGFAVTAGTGDLLVLTNNDGSNAADVEVMVLGE